LSGLVTDSSAAGVGTLLPLAIGLALSPVPVVELILVLFSRRRAVNSMVFVAGLLLLSALALLAGAGGGQAADSGDAGPSALVGWMFVVLGGLLLLVGVKNWRNRRDTSEPPVLASIAGMGPAAVAFLTLGATWVNPKNLVLLLSAGQQVGATAAPVLWGAAFLLVATLPYTAATSYALFGGAAAEQRLDRMRAWLVCRNRLIMGVICSALGLLLLVRGLSALLG
jgi:threonine/homoserine/homoserine lactone efflux protein